MDASAAGRHDDRPPIWRQYQAWDAVAGRTSLTQPFDSDAIGVGADSRPRAGNVYRLRMGPPRLLKTHGQEVVGLIDALCAGGQFGGFRHSPQWRANRAWLCGVFARIFAESRADYVGWYSLLSARLSAQFRTAESSTVAVTQERRVEFGYLTPQAFADRVGLPVRGAWFACPEGASQDSCAPVRLSVPRRVTSTRFSTLDAAYREQWFCMARRRVDDEHLREGRIPASADAYRTASGAPARVRDSILVNLVRLDTAMKYGVVVVELDPDNGSVVSVRKSYMDLGPAVLCGSVVEHVGMGRILSR